MHIFIFIRPKYIYEDKLNKTRKIPKDKPVIIISNHKHWLDIPVMMTVFLTSRPRFVVAKEVKSKGVILSKLTPTHLFNLKDNLNEEESKNLLDNPKYKSRVETMLAKFKELRKAVIKALK